MSRTSGGSWASVLRFARAGLLSCSFAPTQEPVGKGLGACGREKEKNERVKKVPGEEKGVKKWQLFVFEPAVSYCRCLHKYKAEREENRKSDDCID